MRGIILYSSRTGRTERLAQVIKAHIEDLVQVEIYKIDQAPNLKGYDFALIGGWNDRARLDSNASQVLANTDQATIGVFGTMGADPESDHGQRTYANIEKDLAGKRSLGIYFCRGLVDPAMIQMLKSAPSGRVPEELMARMIKTSEESRDSTDEELAQAGRYFRNKIEELIEEEDK